jgi:hypothetical protein
MLIAPLVGCFQELKPETFRVIFAWPIQYGVAAGYHQPKDADQHPKSEKAWAPNCHQRLLYSASFCPALSITTKHASNSSIDQGGGKRRRWHF